MALNAALLPSFLTEPAILDREMATENLLKVFARCIATKGAEEEEEMFSEEEEDYITIEGGETYNRSEESAKENADTLATIADDCNDILAFLQAATVKSPRIIAAPLSLCTYKPSPVWFHQWLGNNLPLTTNAPHYCTVLTGVLSDVTTRLQHAEDLRPVVVAQCNADKETKVWDRLLPTAKQVILVASASDGTPIPTSPPPTIH